MTIQPITTTTPSCFGVMCPKHQDCARYAAIEDPKVTARQATCDHGDGETPMFVKKADDDGH